MPLNGIGVTVVPVCLSACLYQIAPWIAKLRFKPLFTSLALNLSSTWSPYLKIAK